MESKSQRAKRLNYPTINNKPAFFTIAGFLFFIGPFSAITGGLSQKWIVLSLVGYVGLVFMTYHFSNKWPTALPMERVKLLIALIFGFFLIESIVLVQGGN